MRLHFLIAQILIFYLADFVLAAPVATTTWNSNSESGGVILGAVFGFFALVLLCAWLGGQIKCSEVTQILTWSIAFRLSLWNIKTYQIGDNQARPQVTTPARVADRRRWRRKYCRLGRGWQRRRWFWWLKKQMTRAPFCFYNFPNCQWSTRPKTEPITTTQTWSSRIAKYISFGTPTVCVSRQNTDRTLSNMS